MVVASCGRCRAIASISPVSATTVVYFYIDSSKVMVISGSTTHGDPDPGKRTDMLHLEGHSQVLPNTMTLRARSHTDDSSDSRLARGNQAAVLQQGVNASCTYSQRKAGRGPGFR